MDYGVSRFVNLFVNYKILFKINFVHGIFVMLLTNKFYLNSFLDTGMDFSVSKLFASATKAKGAGENVVREIQSGADPKVVLAQR